MNLSFSLLVSTLLATTTTIHTTVLVLGQEPPVESWCPIPPQYAQLNEECPGETEGKKCFTETTNPNTVAVLCENGKFVNTTSFVGAAFTDSPNMAPPTPCAGTGSTAEGGCVISPPIVMSKDAAEDSNVTDINSVDTVDEVPAVTSNTSGGNSADVIVTFGILAAFGSVVLAWL